MIRKTVVCSMLIFLMILSAGCSSKLPASTANSSSKADGKVNLVAMKGPTGMGILPLVEDKKEEGDLDFHIETLPEEVVVGLGKGEIDIAAIPANLAATLFQKLDGELQAVAINVTNVLYIAENGDSIQNIGDLKGKTIFSSGRGATPEAALTLLLKGAFLHPGSDVTVEYSAEATEVATKLLAKPGSIALIQEPFLTSVKGKNDSIRVSLDLDELWKEEFGRDAAIITGVVVARKDFIEKNPAWFPDFLDKYEDSVAYVKEHPAEAAQLIEDYGIMEKAAAEAAIPNSGLSFIRDNEMQEKLTGYLTKLYDFDPKLIGGALPTDDFYFLGYQE